MYIMWGPADEVESHPTGGTYDRPMEEGGGSTTTYPFETWRWRYLEGIGENIILEFVDPSGSGEYHLTMDPSEKDALLHVPGAGLSLMESMGMASKADRFTRSDGTNLPTTMGGQSASMNEFNRLELYAKVNRPPEVKFKDLEAVVTSRIVRDQLHFTWRTDYLKVTNDTVLVPVTIQVPNGQLSFQSKDGIHSATMNIFGRVSTLTGRVVQTFEDPVSKDFPDSLFQQSLKLQSDDKSHKSSATFEYTVKKGKDQIMQFKETSEEMKQTGDQVTLERLLPLATLSPGKYSLEVNATDTLSRQTVSRTAEFTVKAPQETKTAANATPGR